MVSASFVATTQNATFLGSFNAKAPDNLAVYFDQTPVTSQTNLAEICWHSSVGIVILIFVVDFFGPDDYPTVNFGAACSGQSPQQAGTGLLDCTVLASQISACQAVGKKVFLNIGGATGTSSFTNDTQASNFAETLWNLFGTGMGLGSGLRPFGNVTVDGFDISGYRPLLSLSAPPLLTGHPDSRQRKRRVKLLHNLCLLPARPICQRLDRIYYLSAAPQCPYPDASNPMSILLKVSLAPYLWMHMVISHRACYLLRGSV